MSGSLVLVPSLGLYSFCWFALYNIEVMGFVLSYILFHHVWLLLLRSLFFSNKRQKGMYPVGEGRGKLEGGKGGKTVITIY